MSPIPATPTTSDEKTSGTTTIKRRRKKSAPMGSVICAITHSTRERGTAAPGSAAGARHQGETQKERPDGFGDMCHPPLHTRVRDGRAGQGRVRLAEQGKTQ